MHDLRRSVFLATSQGDPHLRSIGELLAPRFEVLLAGSDVENSVPILESLQHVDAVIALLPPNGFTGRAQVMFDIGLAIGCDKPVLLVTSQKTPPRRLRDLWTVSPNATELIAPLLEQLLETFNGYSGRAHANHLELVRLEDWETGQDAKLSQTDIPMSESAVVSVLRDAFAASGATVLESEARTSDRSADLALWAPGLAAVFDLPLPVEIRNLRTRPNATRWSEFRRLLDSTGASSLLVVSPTYVETVRWSDGNRLILVTSLTSLLDRLQHESPERALSAILATARI